VQNSASTEDDLEPEEKVPKEQWFRLSDDDVSLTSEDEVLNQGGVFMLFYEAMGQPALPPKVNVPVTTPVVEAAAVPLTTTDEDAVSTEASHVDEIEETLSAVRLVPPRSDTPQTVIDLRIDQPVPPDSSITTASSAEPDFGDPEQVEDFSNTSSSSQSSPSPTPPRQQSPRPSSPSPSQTRTLTPIMRTSSIADKAAAHRSHQRNVPSMVTAI